MMMRLFWLLLSLTAPLCAGSTLAQIVPDGTLGSEQSRVAPRALGGSSIEGGAIRGFNLFHSFSDFNVSDGARAYFANPTGIQNILTRVTGNTSSNINGTLGVDGTANLFLLNPNGIVFGQNARLDVRGSFLGSTANDIQFGNQGAFSATAPQPPSPLLSISPSALLYTQLKGGSITNRAILEVPDGKNLVLVGSEVRLEEGALLARGGRVDIGAVGGTGSVGFGEGNLLFPQGLARTDVSLDRSGIGVSAGNGGSVAIHSNNLNIVDSIVLAGILPGVGTANSQAGDITLDALGTINITPGSSIRNWVFQNAAGNGGDIRITADSLFFAGSGFISASTFGQGNAGSVRIQAKNNITLDGTTIFSLAETDAQGNAGNIEIQAQNLALLRGGRLNASTFGLGNAGNVTINVRDRIVLDGTNLSLRPSAILSTIEDSAKGQGGNITITTGSLLLRNSAKLDTSVFGEGRGGDIQINASETVSLEGTTQGVGYGSAIFSTIEETGRGTAGNIRITTGSLSVTNGASIQSLTKNQGSAGNITIDARDSVRVDGGSLQNNEGTASGSLNIVILRSDISSSVLQGATGRAGNISIRAGNEILINPTGKVSRGAIIRPTINQDSINLDLLSSPVEIESVAAGRGDAGTITLDAGNRILIDNRGRVITNTTGQGNAGNIMVKAVEGIVLDRDAAIGSLVDDNAIGNGGEIRIETGTLSITNAAQLDTSTFGNGNAGNVIVNARGTVSFTGAQDIFSSGILSTSEKNSTGNAGNIQINAGSLILADSAILSTITTTSGNAGNIAIKTDNQVTLNQGAEISSFASTGASGNGGNIQIEAERLTLSNGSGLRAFTAGKGDAGDVIIKTRGDVILSGFRVDEDGIERSSFINNRVTRTGNGNAGDIQILGNSLILRDRASFEAFTQGRGNAGNIVLEIGDRVLLDESIISNIVGSVLAPGQLGEGKGGTIRIETNQLSLLNGAQLQASTFGRGNAGNIEIKTHDTVFLSGTRLFRNRSLPSAIFSVVASNSIGKGGNIQIETSSMSMKDFARVSVSTGGRGDAGSIDINARNAVSLDSRSLISATSEGNTESRSGNVRITSALLSISDRAQVSVDSEGSGIAGNIEVNARQVRLNNRGFIVAESASQDGGNIKIENADLLLMRRGSAISTTAAAGGNGGNITIDAKTIVAPARENSNIRANAFTGSGGRVEINTQGLFGIQPRSQPTVESDITASSQFGVQGRVTIAQPDVQPTQGITELPVDLLDASNQIAQICPRGRDLGRFVVSGRGSAPSNPLKYLPGTSILTPLMTMEDSANRSAVQTMPQPPQLVEAQGWIRTPNGEIALVARSSEVVLPTIADCPN
ncbi:filamentous hemagglutinin N-terminal domain-containing protein [Leptolyngbya sp. AN03gr2]|uniref:two-partner secretion domain-containing protein n=1 Tax=unclassified Leptolyngbya TaxID=2650499 RepID=UPI003D3178B9